MRRWHRSHGAKEIDPVFDQGYRRIGRDGIEHHVLGPARRQGPGQVVEQAQLGDDAVGDDEDLAVAEPGNGLSQPAAGTRPDQDRRLRYGQEAHGQAGAFHGGTSAVVRSESLIKSDIKETLLQNNRPPGLSLCRIRVS
jgi:hypothetical protein